MPTVLFTISYRASDSLTAAMRQLFLVLMFFVFLQLRTLADALERDKYEGQELYHQYREEFLKIKNTQAEALKAARDAAAAAAASKQEEESKSAWTQAEVALFIQAFNKVSPVVIVLRFVVRYLTLVSSLAVWSIDGSKWPHS